MRVSLINFTMRRKMSTAKVTYHLKPYDRRCNDRVTYTLRRASLISVASLISFLYPYNLKQANSCDIDKSVRELLKSYHRDFSEDLVSEIRSFAVEFKKEIAEKQTIQELLQLLYDYKLVSSFPEFQKLLTLVVTIPVTVASAERSFSKLKLIKPSELIRKFDSANAVREARF